MFDFNLDFISAYQSNYHTIPKGYWFKGGYPSKEDSLAMYAGCAFE